MEGTVYAAALNFKGFLNALSEPLPQSPVLYIKPRNTWNTPGAAIPCPLDMNELRMGGTLGIVVGRTACRVPERTALEYIGGYAVVNDVSVPHSSYFRPAIRERCRDGFCCIGPMLDVTASPSDLEIRISINGELQCVNNTRNLVRSVPRLLAEVTEFMTLRSGDMLLIGEPDNSPLAQPGDRVRVEVRGLGAIENTVRHSV